MPRVLLFDIDGTLLNSGGAGQRAMELALGSAFGIEATNEEIPAAGRTDFAITTDLFRKYGIPEDRDTRQQFTREYYRHLPETLRSQPGRILPGVPQLLEQLNGFSGVCLGLLTGNFHQGAILKLAHYRLEHHFLFGGFGDEHEHRDDVARLAYAAVIEHLACEVAAEDIWVIGDTPADVQCGRAIGARVLAVATGLYSADQLRDCEPDLLLESFADVQETIASLEL